MEEVRHPVPGEGLGEVVVPRDLAHVTTFQKSDVAIEPDLS